MKKYQKKIIKLTAGEVLLRVFDLAVPFFEADQIYRVSAHKYRAEREYDKSNFSEKIKYLKRQGLIESFVEGKDKFIEITAKGLRKVKKCNLDNLKIVRPEIWDGRWRVVIFDVPEKHKNNRDTFRHKLLNLGFQKIQESIYVHPFECANEIKQLSESLSIENNVLIMISEIIQGENSIIEKFLNANVLEQDDLLNRQQNKDKDKDK